MFRYCSIASKESHSLESSVSKLTLYFFLLQLSNQLTTRLKQNNINVLAEVRLQENDPTRAIRTIKVSGIGIK